MSQNQAMSRKPDYKLKLLGWELFYFLVAQLIGLYGGYKILSVTRMPAMETSGSVVSFLIAFVVVTSIIILTLKFLKSGLFFKVLFSLLIFIGAQSILSLFLPGELALLISIEIVLVRFLFRNVFVQNIAIILAISGIGINIGILLTPFAVIILMIILSLYDYIAVYKTKHMVKLFHGLNKKGTPFSLVIPEKVRDVKISLSDVKLGEGRFVMLGTGDIIFPLILAISVLRYSLLSSLFVVFGALLGMAVVHFILLKTHKPVPALPPISALSILTLLVSLLI